MNARQVASGVVIVSALAASVVWPTFEALASEPEYRDSPPVMEYDEAIEECSWISAADNIACLVLPHGDGWGAWGVLAEYEDGSFLLEDGTSFCEPGQPCDESAKNELAESAEPVVAEVSYTG